LAQYFSVKAAAWSGRGAAWRNIGATSTAPTRRHFRQSPAPIGLD
jgi:hypothetical protein